MNYSAFGKIFSTSVCGLGITCWETNSPTLAAATVFLVDFVVFFVPLVVLVVLVDFVVLESLLVFVDLAVLVALVVFSRNIVGPKAAGEPYDKGKR